MAGTALLPRWLRAQQPLRDVKITRIVGFDLPSRRPKLVGKNPLAWFYASKRSISGVLGS